MGRLQDALAGDNGVVDTGIRWCLRLGMDCF